MALKEAVLDITPLSPASNISFELILLSSDHQLRPEKLYWPASDVLAFTLALSFYLTFLLCWDLLHPPPLLACPDLMTTFVRTTTPHPRRPLNIVNFNKQSCFKTQKENCTIKMKHSTKYLPNSIVYPVNCNSSHLLCCAYQLCLAWDVGCLTWSGMGSTKELLVLQSSARGPTHSLFPLTQCLVS